jgi:hypothetical protein
VFAENVVDIPQQQQKRFHCKAHIRRTIRTVYSTECKQYVD